jgi:hypothetical protein
MRKLDYSPNLKPVSSGTPTKIRNIPNISYQQKNIK